MTEQEATAKLNARRAQFRRRATEQGRTIDWYWSASDNQWIAKEYTSTGVSLTLVPKDACGC